MKRRKNCFLAMSSLRVYCKYDSNDFHHKLVFQEENVARGIILTALVLKSYTEMVIVIRFGPKQNQEN